MKEKDKGNARKSGRERENIIEPLNWIEMRRIVLQKVSVQIGW